MAGDITEGLGGMDNIETIDNCVTRLRLQLRDMDKVDEHAIRKAGAKGVMKIDNTNIQVIVGTNVEAVANIMREHHNK
ncbi:glucose PTS transporter subunit EIIB [Salsuginibacillus kocurii]|uniref:glucose PTS transporter subunit EIIB n=1 Tax=Salsuginibacillus kocurii TaxID=427078 RepID=UPI00035F2BDC